MLLKVLEAKKLMDRKKLTVQQAVEQVGISRSSFYKYQDDIFPFHDNAKGKTITFILQMDDEPGILSDVLKSIAASAMVEAIESRPGVHDFKILGRE